SARRTTVLVNPRMSAPAVWARAANGDEVVGARRERNGPAHAHGAECRELDARSGGVRVVRDAVRPPAQDGAQSEPTGRRILETVVAQSDVIRGDGSGRPLERDG